MKKNIKKTLLLITISILAVYLIIINYQGKEGHFLERGEIDGLKYEFIKPRKMLIPRSNFTATLLDNGKVLIIGGVGGSENRQLKRSELYNPATNRFEYGPNLNIARYLHEAVKLKDGRVLIIGGVTEFYKKGSLPKKVREIEIYDPKFNSLKIYGYLQAGRTYPTVNLLNDGRVLIIGFPPLNEKIYGKKINQGVRDINFDYLATAEIFDPTSNVSVLAKMTETRSSHSSVLLDNGKVLIIAGEPSKIFAREDWGHITAEIFDPKTNRFSKAGSMHFRRSMRELVKLEDGRVLIVGGDNVYNHKEIYPSEIFDPKTNTFSICTQNNITRDLGRRIIKLNNRFCLIPDYDKKPDWKILDLKKNIFIDIKTKQLNPGTDVKLYDNRILLLGDRGIYGGYSSLIYKYQETNK